ncbi:phosphatase PAP2 family protein [Rubeoparvulum massiliense]|uniref:phosphatase PAP2 family protein n=1 Tax=Rubeoparvulum massiliense TaxID=1631346 RepID=UPI00065E43B1|nr:phosphatase PAP2 family protein [Rubeoparvulum massiliense]
MELYEKSVIQRNNWIRWYLPLALLLFCIALILSPEHERAQFFIFLLIPCIPAMIKAEERSRSYFWAAAILGIAYYVLNMLVFKMHVWQLKYELVHPNGLFDFLIPMNHFLHSIPFNDGMFIRQFATPWLDQILVPIYVHGFVVPAAVMAVYYVATKQPVKVVQAIFAFHALQYVMILPFHFWVESYQVWQVQNMFDGTFFTDPIVNYRHWLVSGAKVPSFNHAFPSMHTSIATAIIIMALREKNRFFRWIMVIFNVTVIFTTVYLGIHWILDLIGGILLGWSAVKIGDWVVARPTFQLWINQFIERIERVLPERKSKKEMVRA